MLDGDGREVSATRWLLDTLAMCPGADGMRCLHFPAGLVAQAMGSGELGEPPYAPADLWQAQQDEKDASHLEPVAGLSLSRHGGEPASRIRYASFIAMP